MRPIAIVAASRRLGQCRSCRAELEWATLAKSSKAMPFNAPIVTLPVLVSDGPVAWVDMDRTTSHFATCPDAEKFRRRVQFAHRRARA
jgi:hypothetical protein